MGVYKLSSKADTDLAHIYEYTIATFGIGQARQYFEELQQTFEMLTERPELHREASFAGFDLWYYTYKAHAIFFTVTPNELFIVRVLGQTMDFKRHL
jgi:toxin ParE1/3/4